MIFCYVCTIHAIPYHTMRALTKHFDRFRVWGWNWGWVGKAEREVFYFSFYFFLKKSKVFKLQSHRNKNS